MCASSLGSRLCGVAGDGSSVAEDGSAKPFVLHASPFVGHLDCTDRVVII